jgi:hypothetical protein
MGVRCSSDQKSRGLRRHQLPIVSGWFVASPDKLPQIPTLFVQHANAQKRAGSRKQPAHQCVHSREVCGITRRGLKKRGRPRAGPISTNTRTTPAAKYLCTFFPGRAVHWPSGQERANCCPNVQGPKSGDLSKRSCFRPKASFCEA